MTKQSTQKGCWSPTVSELVLNLREALCAVVPYFERAKIPWREPDAYDQWDNVATALYEGLVVENVRYGVEAQIRLPHYDAAFQDFETLSFFEVNPRTHSDKYLAFFKFTSKEQAFDVVECRLVTASAVLLDEAPVIIPVSSARFALRVRRSAKTLEQVDILSICLDD